MGAHLDIIADPVNDCTPGSLEKLSRTKAGQGISRVSMDAAPDANRKDQLGCQVNVGLTLVKPASSTPGLIVTAPRQ